MLALSSLHIMIGVGSPLAGGAHGAEVQMAHVPLMHGGDGGGGEPSVAVVGGGDLQARAAALAAVGAVAGETRERALTGD